MNMKTETGGWAYPVDSLQSSVSGNGMTLRDYFAGQALAGDMANSADGVLGDDAEQQYLVMRAEFIYRMADAMIAVRKATS